MNSSSYTGEELLAVYVTAFGAAIKTLNNLQGGDRDAELAKRAGYLSATMDTMPMIDKTSLRPTIDRDLQLVQSQMEYRASH